jgi:hypothetical protein
VVRIEKWRSFERCWMDGVWALVRISWFWEKAETRS